MRLLATLASLAGPRGPTQSHLTLAHALWRSTVRPGDVVVDATAGRGHDTAVLAELAGAAGRVYAMDVDAAALAECEARVRAAAPDLGAFAPILGSHAAPPPGLEPRRARLVVFNLGYLPSKGAAEGVPTTTAETTTAALCDWALGAVAPGGAVSVSVYPGHASGARESLAVRALARALSPSAWRSTEHVAVNHGPDAPYVVSLHRLFRDDRENADDDFAAARAAALGAIR